MKIKRTLVVVFFLGMIILIGLRFFQEKPQVLKQAAPKKDPIVALLYTNTEQSKEKKTVDSHLTKHQGSEACSEVWESVQTGKIEDLYSQFKLKVFSVSKECQKLQERIFPGISLLLQKSCSEEQTEQFCIGALSIYRAVIWGLSAADGNPKEMTDQLVLAKVVTNIFRVDKLNIILARHYADELLERYPESRAANYAYLTVAMLAAQLDANFAKDFQKNLTEATVRFPEDEPIQKLYLESVKPIGSRDWKDFETRLNSYERDNPNSYLVPYERAHMLFHTNNIEKALKQLDVALNMAPPESQEQIQWVIKRIHSNDKDSFNSSFGFQFDDLLD